MELREKREVQSVSGWEAAEPEAFLPFVLEHCIEQLAPRLADVGGKEVTVHELVIDPRRRRVNFSAKLRSIVLKVALILDGHRISANKPRRSRESFAELVRQTFANVALANLHFVAPRLVPFKGRILRNAPDRLQVECEISNFVGVLR